LTVGQQNNNRVIGGSIGRLQKRSRLHGIAGENLRIFAFCLPNALYMPGQTCGRLFGFLSPK
jgi:hypothetical protein